MARPACALQSQRALQSRSITNNPIDRGSLASPSIHEVPSAGLPSDS